MKTGKILVNKTKKGFEIRCDLHNNKPPIALVGFEINNDMADKECQIELVNGLPVCVAIEGKEYRRRQGPRDRGTHQGGKIGPAASSPAPSARAPYNFIPLNETPVCFPESPAREQNKWLDGHSGHIALHIEAKTPLYIRGASVEPEVENQDISDFFGPGGILRIPGSSLRGMVRTLVEIASFGLFGNESTNTKKRFYYRAVGDMGSLGQSYRLDMAKVKAGILKGKSGRLEIHPSAGIYRVNGSFNDSDQFCIPGTGIVLDKFKFKKVFFKPVEPTRHTHRKGQLQLNYALVSDVRESSADGLMEGCLVCSGPFGTKKHMQWIIAGPSGSGISIPDSVEEDYRNDSTRVEKVNLLDQLQEHPEGVPCFYLQKGDNQNSIRAFGHTGFFRLPYGKTVSDHIPAALRQEDKVDCAGALFGVLGKWQGRVRFEDAILADRQADVLMEETSPKILSGPKPTTFQHYLEPSGGAPQHWDTDANIRGYKLYWHRKTPETGQFGWSEGEIRVDTQHTKIRPARAGTRFIARIRFDGLTYEELGALLFVLDLPVGCHHKLGMGKPLGLGSVSIKPTLYLTNRSDRYRKLFSNDGWHLSDKVGDMETCKTAFEKFVLDKMATTDRNGASSLWSTPRMIELKRMLNWALAESGGDGWLGKTSYMEIGPKNTNEFHGRPVLPRPTGI